MGHNGPAAPACPARDGRWAAEVRWVSAGTALLLSTLVAVDSLYGRLTWQRGALWAALAALLFVVLVPPRVTAGAGWLASRGVLGERRVRTDRLVALHWPELRGGTVRPVVLRDEEGTRLELDVQVLTAAPAVWLLLEEGARASLRHGTLVQGSRALERLALRVEEETARAVFHASGLTDAL
ncbi:hypothetical protein [Streptomyces sp. NPDC048172]|uniref:hypothetical protein n=1 Tax=Streptomyces sp. NPDC048172 TaxID=3365505 RepID=UPI0037202A09